MGGWCGNQNNEDMYFPCRHFVCRTAIGFYWSRAEFGAFINCNLKGLMREFKHIFWMMHAVPFLLCPTNKAIWIASASLVVLKSNKSSLQEVMNINFTARMWLSSVDGGWERRWKTNAKSHFSLSFFFVRCRNCALVNTSKEDITNKL